MDNNIDSLLQNRMDIQEKLKRLTEELDKTEKKIRDICKHEMTSITYEYDGHKNIKIVRCDICNLYLHK
jgi:peptidoglycan hydrolase CwlO-like protein